MPFTSCLLCLAEHTSGMGILRGINDYDNYLKPHFMQALNEDCKIHRYGLFRIRAVRNACGISRSGSYSKAEKSWAEQRDYIDEALSLLPQPLALQAQGELSSLIPQH